jgi:hypothetical protein
LDIFRFEVFFFFWKDFGVMAHGILVVVIAPLFKCQL